MGFYSTTYVPLLPDAIRERREEIGLSRKELSEITGLSIRTIESYEQLPKDGREFRLPSKQNLQLMGEALNCYFYVSWHPTDMTPRLQNLFTNRPRKNI